jgi:hypothetical protein
VSYRNLRPAVGRTAVPTPDENPRPAPPVPASETNNDCQVKFELIQVRYENLCKSAGYANTEADQKHAAVAKKQNLIGNRLRTTASSFPRRPRYRIVIKQSTARAARWRDQGKECRLDLLADRTSATTMRANQMRLWFASFAYVLLCALRRIGLAHTQFANATCGSIRLKLLKIDRLVRVSVRRVRHRHSFRLPVAT